MEEKLFEDIIGNNKVKEYLKTTIETKNISHSYMFVGKSRHWKENASTRICKKDNVLK